VCLWDA
jgi:hypothetical protein